MEKLKSFKNKIKKWLLKIKIKNKLEQLKKFFSRIKLIF